VQLTLTFSLNVTFLKEGAKTCNAVVNIYTAYRRIIK